MTVQPFISSVSVTFKSRALFRENFLDQYSALSFGIVFRQLCPCQKHPSTKIARRELRKTKSGFPKARYLRRQPLSPQRLKISRRRSSVDLLRSDLTACITRDRVDFENVSANLLLLQILRQCPSDKLSKSHGHRISDYLLQLCLRPAEIKGFGKSLYESSFASR